MNNHHSNNLQSFLRIIRQKNPILTRMQIGPERSVMVANVNGLPYKAIRYDGEYVDLQECTALEVCQLMRWNNVERQSPG